MFNLTKLQKNCYNCCCETLKIDLKWYSVMLLTTPRGNTLHWAAGRRLQCFPPLVVLVCLLANTDSLSVKTGSASLQANSVWGALRGLETFSQLIYHCPVTGMVFILLTCTCVKLTCLCLNYFILFYILLFICYYFSKCSETFKLAICQFSRHIKYMRILSYFTDFH